MKKKFINVDEIVDNYLDNDAMTDREVKISSANVIKWADDKFHDRVSKSISDAYSSEKMREIQAKKFKGKKHKEISKDLIRQARVGTTRNETTKKKISEKNHGNNHRSKSIMTPYGMFTSLKEAAEQTGIHAGRIRMYTRMPSMMAEWFFLTQDKNSHDIKIYEVKKRYKPIVTPIGIFVQLAAAAQAYMSILNYTEASCKGWLIRQMKNNSKEYYYITHEEYILLTGNDI